MRGTERSSPASYSCSLSAVSPPPQFQMTVTLAVQQQLKNKRKLHMNMMKGKVLKDGQDRTDVLKVPFLIIVSNSEVC